MNKYALYVEKHVCPSVLDLFSALFTQDYAGIVPFLKKAQQQNLLLFILCYEFHIS